MAKKPIRNKFRDRIGDYYLTNREITKQYDAEHKESSVSQDKKSWKGSEKIMIIVTLAALALLAAKYLLF
ncbi:hypothetical protein MASR2M70_09930 [Bacillota bacterium]